MFFLTCQVGTILFYFRLFRFGFNIKYYAAIFSAEFVNNARVSYIYMVS